MKRPIHTLILTALAAALLGGCSKARIPEPETGLFTLSLELPGATQAKTRALTEPQENWFQTVDILLFEKDGTDEKFLQRIQIGESVIDHTTHIKTLRVPLPVDPDREVRLVMLANLQSEVDAAGLSAGMEKEQALERVRFSTSAAWDNTTPRYLPMWGESTGFYVITPTTIFTSVQMLRAVARIDILQSSELAATGNFTLAGAALFNYHTQAQAAPDAGKYSHITRSVSSVSTPAGAVVTEGPVIHTLSGSRSLRDIYVGEYSNRSRTEQERTRFAVRGSYQGGPAKWYALAMTNTSGEVFDLLRNHRYEVTITQVIGEGADTPQEAFDEEKSYLSADVIPWDMSVAIEGNFDDDDDDDDDGYTLRISQTHFNFNADGRGYWVTDYFTEQGGRWYNSISYPYKDHLIDIETDHPGGWEIDRITDELGNELTGDACWVTIEKDIRIGIDPYSHPNYPDQHYLALEPNVTDQVRRARIHVRAGTTEYVINVSQECIPDCGHNGVPGTVEAWGQTYRTHVYAATYQHKTVRCWMVDWIRAVDPIYEDADFIYKGYALNSDGSPRAYHFRTRELWDGFDPCPEGWHIPYYGAEQAYMYHTPYPYVSNTSAIPVAEVSGMPTHLQWWFDPDNLAATIIYNPATQTYSPRVSSAFEPAFRYVATKTGFYTPPTKLIYVSGWQYTGSQYKYTGQESIKETQFDTHFAPVRCVQDMRTPITENLPEAWK